ncbi:c-type cytochrome [uncultured Devosia sp.]|uniref:c-type cytochrome n=1 Tax=uncultured Devosia sp. TaxID=211434 RepID=UPI0035CA9475
MDSFELNKIIGAVLGTLLFVMGIGFVAEAIYAPKEDIGPGYLLPEPEPVATADAGAPAEAEVPLGTLLASADATRGQAAVRKCQSCHNFGEGEPSKQGPHLYGVVGRPEGGVEDFAYSDGMMAHNAAGDVWSFENLNTFITAPKVYVPGTKMTFAGVKSPQERADILAYLQSLSADPVPFPAADVAPAAPAPGDAAAPAEAPATDSDPSDPATAAPDNVTEPVAPAGAVATPTETQSETPVVGTPSTSGTPATTQAPTANPSSSETEPDPATPETAPAAQ